MHFAEQPQIGRDETGLLRLGKSQIEAVVNGVVKLTGDGDGPRRQSCCTHERIEEPGQARGDLVDLSLADTAEPCRPPCGIAHLGYQKIRRDQSSSVLDNGYRSARVRLIPEETISVQRSRR